MNSKKVMIQTRIEKFQQTMRQNSLDVVFIARPENVFYFSGFNPIIYSHAAYVLIDKNCARLLIPCIRNDHAKKEGCLDEVLLYGKWGANKSLAMDPFDAITIIVGKEPKRVGIEGDYASINWVSRLKEALCITELADISKDVAMQKIIKDFYEIDCIRKSAKLVDCGISKAIETLDAGKSEAEACTEAQYAMRRLWQKSYSDYEISGFGSSQSAQIDSLVVWCMANERISYGCDCPNSHIPKQGDLVLPMSWARIDGYACENERTVMVGEVDALRNSAYEAMLRARASMFSILRPGATFEALYIAAMKEFEDAGFGKILPGRCGHGIGLSSHEFPSLAKGNEITLKPGMVFTVEPGLMDKDWGGVRHSDTVLVTENGYELLTNYQNGRIMIKNCV